MTHLAFRHRQNTRRIRQRRLRVESLERRELFAVATANLDVVQHDTGNTTSSVTVTTVLADHGFQIRGGTNRADYNIQIGASATDDVAGGVLITSVRQLSRNNGESGALAGAQHATSSVDNDGSGGYFIPIHNTSLGGNDGGSEYNINVAAAYFPYADGWLGGFVGNNGVNGGALVSLVGHLSLQLGTHFVDAVAGQSTVNLTSLGISSQTDGILLVNGGKNEDNFASVRANANGTWTVFNHDNGINGTDFERDPVVFAYLPRNSSLTAGMTFGRFLGNGTIVSATSQGIATVTETANGTYRLVIPGQSPATGTLLVVPEGGDSNNVDNVVSFQADGNGWIIETRDMLAMGLQSMPDAEPVANFVFIPSAGKTRVEVDGVGDLRISAAAIANDTLTIEVVGSNVRVRDPNNAITAGIGAISVDTNTVLVPLAKFAGKILVNSAGGSDVITLNYATPFNRAIEVTGGDSTQVELQLPNSGNQAQLINSVGKILLDSLDGTFSDTTVTSSGVSRIRVYGNGGSDTITVGDLSAIYNASTSPVEVLGGDAADSIVVQTGGILTVDSSPSASIDLQGGRLIVTGSATVDALSGTAAGVQLNNATLTFGTGTNTALTGSVDGTGGLTKIGSGTFSFNGTTTYSGTFQVSEGTLAGTGIIAGTLIVAAGAILSPGNSVGNFSAGDVTLQSGSTLLLELGDQLRSAGTVTLTGATLQFSSPSVPSPGAQFTIVDGVNNVVGQFNNSADGALLLSTEGVWFHIRYVGSDVVLVRNQVPVSEDIATSTLEDQSVVVSPALSDPDGDEVSVTIIDAPSHGSLSGFNSVTGEVTYLPGPHFSGTDSYTYTVSDGDLTSAIVTVTITVNAVADDPTLSVSSASGSENSPIALPIAASLVDNNGTLPEVLSVTISNVPNDAVLSAGTPNGDGTSYTLTPAQLVGLTLTKHDNNAFNAPFNLTVTATATEANGSTASTSLPLTVTVMNAAPTALQEAVLLDGLEVMPESGNQVISAPGVPVTFRVSANDLVAGDLDKPYRFSLAWAPGVVHTQVVTTLADVVEFTYDYVGHAQPSSYVPQLTVTELDSGNTHNGDSTLVTISLTKVVLSNIVLIEGTLYVGGSTAGDRIIIQPGSGGGVSLRYNNALTKSYSVHNRVVVYGNAGNDTITVSNTNVPVAFFGGAGNDYLAGGSSGDILDGGAGNDRLLAGSGDDLIFGGPGNDTLAAGLGNDTVYGDSYLNDEGEVVVPPAAQHGKDTISGEGGNDNLFAEGGNDTVNGGLGTDTLHGGDGNDTLSGDDGIDTLFGGLGADKLYGRAGSDLLLGGGGVDTLYGGAGEDVLHGSALLLESDEALLALAALWLEGDQVPVVSELESISENDSSVDLLYGEAGEDTYLLYLAFFMDKVNGTSELKTSNIVPL